MERLFTIDLVALEYGHAVDRPGRCWPGRCLRRLDVTATREPQFRRCAPMAAPTPFPAMNGAFVPLDDLARRALLNYCSRRMIGSTLARPRVITVARH